jgi:2-polyprenyl-3-methyl-5-hydroxy-6-metoxy-1,4-benzoquinol methylase
LGLQEAENNRVDARLGAQTGIHTMTTPESRSAMVDANRSNWDSRVPVHLDSAFYDVAGFIERREPRLDAVEREEVGDVAGKSLLHLQCHIGIDTVSWALLGAAATGVDFSAPALEAARDIARQMYVDVSFVQSDVLQLDLRRQFDVVVATHGVLCSLMDLAWLVPGKPAVSLPH